MRNITDYDTRRRIAGLPFPEIRDWSFARMAIEVVGIVLTVTLISHYFTK